MVGVYEMSHFVNYHIPETFLGFVNKLKVQSDFASLWLAGAPPAGHLPYADTGISDSHFFSRRSFLSLSFTSFTKT